MSLIFVSNDASTLWNWPLKKLLTKTKKDGHNLRLATYVGNP
jgi:hypothetical protein